MALLIFLINFLSSSKTLGRVFISISSIHLIILLYSIFGVGRWKGFGMVIITVISYSVIVIGFVLIALFGKKDIFSK